MSQCAIPIRPVQLLGWAPHADVAQLVEHNLAKVGVAGSNPVVRSRSEALSGASDSRPGPSIARAGSFGGHHRLLSAMERRASDRLGSRVVTSIVVPRGTW